MAGVQRSGIDRCVMRVFKGRKMGLKYRRHGYKFAYDIPGNWTDEDDIGDAAEAAADDYWCNRDGWETQWPVTFDILRADGELIGSREVAVEMEPVFNAAAHNA